jgi:sigma-E factor negative regulatory protein RseC
MVKEEGLVQTVLHGRAKVQIQKSSSCQTCESKGACGVFSDKGMVIEMINELDAKEGDMVEISVPEGSLLKLSLLVYLIPVLALIAGAYAGGLWAQSSHTQSPLASILGGAFAMALAFYLLKRLDRVAQVKRKYQPRMTRILVNANSLQPDDNK